MVTRDRGADPRDTSKGGHDSLGPPYESSVLAAKLAAARERRLQVLAARAAAQGEPTEEERRAKLPPFVPRFVPLSEPTPRAPSAVGTSAGRTVDERPAPGPSTPAPSPPAPLSSRPAVMPSGLQHAPPRSLEDVAAAPRPVSAPIQAEAATANPVPRAAATAASARAGPRAGATPGRRRPGSTARSAPAPDAPAHVPTRPSRAPLWVVWVLPLGLVTVAGLLTALLVFDPWQMRAPTGEVVAPERAAPVPAAPAETLSASEGPPPREVPEEPSATTVVEETASEAVVGDAAVPAPTRSRPGAVEQASVPAGRDAAADATDIAGPQAVEPRSAGDGQTATTVGDPTGAARVIVHFPADAADEAREMEATLRAAGVANVVRLSAPFSISTTNVRYYRAEYRAAADVVAGLAASHAGEGTMVEIRDFTTYRPQPSPGTIELWLAGANDAATQVDPLPGAEPAPVDDGAAGGPSPRVAPLAAPARLAERERLEDEVKSMLRTRLQGLQPD